MKHIFIISIIILASSYMNKQERKVRFDFKEISLTAYLWTINDKTEKWNFYVAYFCRIDSNGNCSIARKDKFNGQEECYNEKLPNNFDNNLNQINFSELGNRYFPPKDKPLIYDGFNYYLIYESNELKKSISFIPNSLNNSFLKNFQNELEKFVYSANSKSQTPIDYNKTILDIRENIEDSTELPQIKKTVSFH